MKLIMKIIIRIIGFSMAIIAIGLALGLGINLESDWGPLKLAIFIFMVFLIVFSIRLIIERNFSFNLQNDNFQIVIKVGGLILFMGLFLSILQSCG